MHLELKFGKRGSQLLYALAPAGIASEMMLMYRCDAPIWICYPRSPFCSTECHESTVLASDEGDTTVCAVASVSAIGLFNEVQSCADASKPV